METFIKFDQLKVRWFGQETQVQVRSTTKITEYISYHGIVFKFVDTIVYEDHQKTFHLYREVEVQDIINQVIC